MLIFLHHVLLITYFSSCSSLSYLYLFGQGRRRREQSFAPTCQQICSSSSCSSCSLLRKYILGDCLLVFKKENYFFAFNMGPILTYGFNASFLGFWNRSELL